MTGNNLILHKALVVLWYSVRVNVHSVCVVLCCVVLCCVVLCCVVLCCVVLCCVVLWYSVRMYVHSVHGTKLEKLIIQLRRP